MEEINMKWFNEQSRILQVILLLIPGVNWIVEIFVRTTAVLEKQDEENVLGLLLAIFTFGIFGWVDLVWVILYNHLLFAK